ncbi:SDR family oxidoreductase [Herbaspirillum seropedicae]|uniref:Short-chain alcohol dehydrogenase protein n=1 Tax=Herbaspirillum seropedicae (strain SmR1) TaxID=757424 RepID=D8IWN3_HERSS|nr:SDR family oxidoreductase [Herbaspirillum seropedicae]ADJ64053.1 short-chain alcohol dehydrogenase protein [Herbaspirillum seropedicae SmR1]AKN66017.1 short-chain dehydrogenase [Herbaspirillum seropedicae]NQE29162.1 short-chain dehydrogenase [Herbaspirillum seropedicae]UMU22007.1 SDR family oxidoreductase [Herbaspirillum seropedicae]
MNTPTQSPRIALITGGSRGLGKNTALHLARDGAGVILTYVGNQQAAEATVAELQALGAVAAALRLDLADSASFPAFAQAVREALKTHWQAEHFHYLVNNGGMGMHASIEETSEAVFDALFKVHLKGPFFLTQALLPLLAQGGRIINISSGLARFSLPGYAAYASMKGGVEVMTRYMAKEFGARGIVVNTVAPGAIETDFGGGRVRDNAELNSFVAHQTALGRAGLPDDIGAAIASLLRPDNGWINAQRVEVSGGMFI